MVAADDSVAITLTKAEALVLGDWLSELLDKGNREATLDPGERVALSNLLCVLEPELVEVFDPQYAEIVERAKRALLLDE
jgi:hypothetical protein